MTIKALYPDPVDEQKVAEVVMAYDDLTVGEMMKLERLSGKVLSDFEESVRGGSRTDLLVLFFVCRLREEPKLTFDKIQAMPYHAIHFVSAEDDEDAAAEGSDGGEGKAPSDEPDAEPLTA